MQFAILLDRINSLVAALNFELENDAVELDVEQISRELEVAILNLEKYVPCSFEEAHAVSSFFLELIDKIHDDVDLAKKYARLAAQNLHHMKVHCLSAVGQ